MVSKNQIALMQMVSSADPIANMQQLREQLAAYDFAAVKMLVLPENFAAYGSPNYQRIAQQEGVALIHWLTTREAPADSIIGQLVQLAQSHKIWIVAGTLPIASNQVNSKPTATTLVIDDQGELKGRYDKIHLFDALVADSQSHYRESDTYQHGRGLTVVDTPLGRLGLAVCYDLRFAEMFACLRQMGAELIALPSAFTWVTGKAHWRSLVQARAIETGCYFLAPNQGGQHNEKRKTWGHSMIVNPWGDVVAEMDEGPGMVTAAMELEAIHFARRSLPTQHHRISRRVNITGLN